MPIERVKQILAATEAVEGTAETIVAGDGGIIAVDPSYTPDIQSFKREPVRETLSRIGVVTGRRGAAVNFKSEMRGSGSATTAPPFGKYFQSAGLEEKNLDQINIGAITGGPFEAGEVITGGTSAATGIVTREAATGATELLFITTAGTFVTTEVITGSDSAATATSSAGPTQKGLVYRPRPVATCEDNAMTVKFVESGLCNLAGTSLETIIKTIKGARSNIQFDFVSGEPVMITHEMMGVYKAPVDGSLFSPVVYGTVIPKPFLNASMTVNGVSLLLSSMNLNLNNVLTLRQDVNDADGYISAVITDRDPAGTIDPELTTIAIHDFHGLLTADTEFYIEATVGTTTGNQFIIAIPNAQYTELPNGEREGITTVQAGFVLNAQANIDTDFFLMSI